MEVEEQTIDAGDGNGADDVPFGIERLWYTVSRKFGFAAAQLEVLLAKKTVSVVSHKLGHGRQVPRRQDD